MWTRRQLICLEGMGIQAWVQRDCAAAAAADSAVGASDNDLATAAQAPDLEALQGQVAVCTACPLHQSRTQAVFGVGDPHASLMIVGEAPGADEDRLGEPFVGRAGRLLDQMLRAIGLSREQVYITNVLKSRPPRNRDPNPDEVAACEPYLRRQIELVAPRLIVALGRVAAQHLLKTNSALGRLRGTPHQYGPRETPLLVSYHPAYLLRNPPGKRQAWEDLRRVRDMLAEVPA